MSDQHLLHPPSDEHPNRPVYISGLVDRNVEGRSWWLPVIAGGLVSVMAATAISFGSRVVTGGETSAVLTAQVSEMREDGKESKRLLQDLLIKAGSLYTRAEAQTDREAAERRFQSMEGRIDTLGRRIETLENNYRMMQQLIVTPPLQHSLPRGR